MHGEIKLGRWLPFTAEQVIHWGRGMIWNPAVRMKGMPIRGFDRLVNGESVMTIDDNGGLKTLTLPRWGNPRGTEFRYVDFGGVVEEESRVRCLHHSDSLACWILRRDRPV